ncbi:alpha-amylase family glycosyl hydrolase [Halanaerobacter jeridensis]|uniref:Glycosidase n=1 Tax=Halanaerobacter jeridensis TaxID=706427 RepID=A0A938XS95_9FIRM|nr:alpha-amylase family glycosyl hydrolase [Halanaerobacter jeridensis]MBM7556555.1 glycosidase [Halanaerobacter jeridensis]
MKSIDNINLKKLIQNKDYYPSPDAWEEEVLYFLLVDRFSNGVEEEQYDPNSDYESAFASEDSRKDWERAGKRWNGGTLNGIKSKLDYLEELGITAIWVSPILKQVAFEETYHGYGAQNFLEIDSHFGSKEELKELVDAAHERGIYVILDVVLNHTGNVFQYQENSPCYDGSEFSIKGFNDGTGSPTISVSEPDFDKAWPDGGVWPKELMSAETFSQKGVICDWDNFPEYVEGDFFTLKNIDTGYYQGDEFVPSQALKNLTEIFKYWIAYADLDGFRLDTAKHLWTGAVRYFATHIHEFATSIGKKNFYIIGEITGGMEAAIDKIKHTGLDAALGINKVPERLEQSAKGYTSPTKFFNVFKNINLPIEDHYKWYRDNVVTMFDDHDMATQPDLKERFCANEETADLLLNALFLNLMSVGIPCIYYGTEQGFDGSGRDDKYVREAMFGGEFGAFRSKGKHFFNQENQIYDELSKIIEIRKEYITLQQGRQYLRKVSYDGSNFVLPTKNDSARYTGLIVWSRILSSQEIVLAINCSLENKHQVEAVVEKDLHELGDKWECIYSCQAEQIGSESQIYNKQDNNVIKVSVPPSGAVVYKPKS